MARVKQTVKEFAENTTAHGIGRVATSKAIWLRALWGIIFLGTCSMCIYEIYLLLNLYFQRPVTVQRSVIFDEVEFPAVSFCNLNPVRTSMLHLADSVNLTDLVRQFDQSTINQLTGYSESDRRKRDIHSYQMFANDFTSSNQHELIINKYAVHSIPTDKLTNGTFYYGEHKNIVSENDINRRVKRQGGDPGTTFRPPTIPPTDAPDSGGSGGYDPIDDVYVPVSDLEDMPWFDNTDGQVSSEVQNSQELTRALYDVDINIRRQMGHQLQDLMQECTWNGIVCTPLNISGFMSRKYGNCFTFNSGAFAEKLIQTRPGQSYGLSMTLFIDQEEYIFSVTPSAGVRVLVHNQNQHPFMEEDGFNINTGQRTAVKLQKIIYKRLGGEFGNCTDGKGFKLNYDAKYSVTACLKSCYQIKIIKECDCADSTLAVPSNKPICETEREVSCMNGVHSDIEDGKVKCKCPELCKDTQYRQSVSSSEWPGDALVDVLTISYRNRSDALDSALMQESGLSRNLLKLDVYFEELKYDYVEELEAYSLSKLLGDMGGQLGLWIGVSVLTLIEFIQFIGELITQCCKKEDARVGSMENLKKEKSKIAFEINSSEKKVPPLPANTVSVDTQFRN